jgi:mono/diheme cytochrome c family protein
MAGGRITLPFCLILPYCFLLFWVFPAHLHPATDNVSFQGDAGKGRLLFTGEQRFRNGGAACIACHHVGGFPGGGGVLGPDLTKTYSDYGAEGLSSAQAEMPFPTMKPLYANRPLLPEERAHLTEFLRVAGSSAPDDAAKRPVYVALAGIAVLFLLLLAFGRGRLSAVRKSLAADRTGKGGNNR